MSEYAYCALLLHAAKKPITEENVKKIFEAAEIKADETKIKALVESLQNINIDEILQQAILPQKIEEKEEKKEEEKEKGLEEAAAGLEALFG